MPILYDIKEAGNLKRKELSIIFTFLIIGISIVPSIVGHNDPTSISVYHNDFISMTADKGGVRGGWFQHDKLVASDGDIGEFFGESVSISGDYVVIGAHNDDDNGFGSGSAYVFKRDGSSWTEEQKLTASDGEDGDEFGISVSIDGSYALIGAYRDESYTGSAYVFKKSSSNIHCFGDLNWNDVEPGTTVGGSLIVENIGDPESLLDWEIESYPDWGTWTFIPDSGEDLTPEDGMITINVEVAAPDEPETEFTGEVKIINSEDPDDICIIDVSLATPVSQPIQQSLFQKVFERFPNAFPILRHLLGL